MTCLPEVSPSCSAPRSKPTTTVDVTEFLWACLALFDDDAEGLDTTAVYLPPWRDLHTVANARERILRLLAETPEGAPLASFLPSAAPPD